MALGPDPLSQLLHGDRVTHGLEKVHPRPHMVIGSVTNMTSWGSGVNQVFVEVFSEKVGPNVSQL